MNGDWHSASYFLLFPMAGSFWEHPWVILDLSKKIEKNVKNDKKNSPKNRKSLPTDQNTEPINEWKLAFCITFCALFDGGKLQGPSLRHSRHFEKNVKNRQKITS